MGRNSLGRTSLIGLAVLLAGFLVLNISEKPAHADNDQCFSICKYEDSTGRKYLSESGGDCDSVCNDALRKCQQGGNGGCHLVDECTSTNCG